MNRKKRLIVFSLTISILLTGCSLQHSSKYEQAINKPVILIEQKEEKIGEEVIIKSEINAPSNEDKKQEILDYIATLKGVNQVIIYDASSSLTEIYKDEEKDAQILQDQNYSEDIFLYALKQNPMIQIYYYGSKIGKDKESSIALQYPNVTYVEPDQNVNEVIEKYYKINYVTGYCIMKFREGKASIEEFNLEEFIIDLKEKFGDIDKQEIIDGVLLFGDYVQNTELFKKGEEFSDAVAEQLKPYVESAIPKVENAWKKVKPYIEQGMDKVEELYDEHKPEIEEELNKVKEKIKNLFGN